MKIKIAILIVIFLAGCVSFNPYRHGFDENDIIAPEPYYVKWMEKPEAKSFIKPGFNYDMLITHPKKFYANCRNAIMVEIKNNGSTPLFIYNIEVNIENKSYKWDGNEGIEIQIGEKRAFVASFVAPPPGTYEYRIGVYFMAKKLGWYDYGCRYSRMYEMHVVEYDGRGSYKFYKNYYVYFDRIKKLVNPYDGIVVQRANIACRNYGSTYNVAKICAIFDYLRKEMKYANDTNDEWNSPSVALLHGGDCEEFAMTMAAMVKAEGGTVRVYLTDSHAFAAVYIGKDLTILDSIDSYYHANLSYAVFEDKFGYWIVADMLSSFYLGCLPVGGYAKGENGKLYEWGIETHNLYAIDVVG